MVDHLGVRTLDLDRVRREVAVNVKGELCVYSEERGVELPLREDPARSEIWIQS